MKIIVTHFSPDLDALTACWLIKRFFPEWKQANIKYVSAGSTYEDYPVDSRANIIHVDTGLGRFDHHQTNDFTCSAKLVLNFLIKKNHIKNNSQSALIRLIDFVNEVDHFHQVFYPDPSADRYELMLHQLVEGLKAVTSSYNQLEETVFILLDAGLFLLKTRINAEEEIKKGYVFQSKWGKTIALETKNNETLNLALKMQFHLAVKKDPTKGNVRIKTLPGNQYNLTPLYQKIIKVDQKGTWFLHVSKNMLLNGTAKSTRFTPSPLSVKKLIEIIKSV